MLPARLAALLQIRPGEEKLVALQVALTLAPSVGGAIGSPGVEALFYARFGVAFLPYMYIALGMVTFLTSMIITVLLGRISKRRLYLGLPLCLGGLLIVARILVGLDLNWFYPVLWLSMYLLWALQALLSWGMAGTIFNTRQAKRLFPLIGAGGILGIALGGLATQPLVQLIGTENLLLVWAGTLILTFGLVMLLTRHMPETYTLPWRQEPRITEALQRGYRFVRRSRLMRWISVAAILYGILFFSLAFPFSKAVAVQYPEEDALAGFLGIFQGITTAVAFLTSLLAANRLYARIGFMGAILFLATIYFLGFGVLISVTAFAALLAFRFLQMVWLQGVAATAYQAIFNIVPPERREQTRTFISGVPEQVGVISVGLLLAVGEQTLQAQHMFFIGLGTALVATIVVWQARRAYQGALLDALRTGQSLVFSSEEAPFGGFQRDAAAVEAVAAGLSDANPAVRRLSAEIMGNLATPDLAETLVELLDDEEAAVRAAGLRALAQAQANQAILEIASSLQDPEAAVRLSAIRALSRLAQFPRGLRTYVAPLLEDPDWSVSAGAAGALLASGPDEEAEKLLITMARQPESEARILGLQTLADAGSLVAYELAAEALNDEDSAVRYAATRAIYQAAPEQCLNPLIQTLADDDSHVRAGVAEAIGRIGQQALPAIVTALSEPQLEEGALAALEKLPVSAAAQSLRSYAQSRIDSALRYRHFWQGVQVVASEAEPRQQDILDMLRASLRDSAIRHGYFALRAIGLLADREAIALARENLASSNPNQRANALETLDSVAERDTIRPLLKLWEPGEEGTILPDNWPLELLADPDPWIRACVSLAAVQLEDAQIQTTLAAMAEDDPDGFVRETLSQLRQTSSLARSEGDQTMDTAATMSIMERILSLRRISLFQELSPSDLKQLASIAGEHVFLDGDVITRQGEPGDEMYIIVSGEVEVQQERADGPVAIAVRQPGDSVGEMAVISQEPRMATLVAKGEVRLLCLEQKSFESILRQRPEIGMAVMRVLIARLKEAKAVVHI